jgi:cytochrome c-type biogenesis protein CcmH
MLLWIAFALLTAAVLAAVLAPLARPDGEEAAVPADAGTVAVYRDQLEEIEAERARGLVGAAEADAAKLEVSRRLLASAARAGQGGARTAKLGALGASHATVAFATAVAVPLLTLALYLAYGSPGLPSNPFSARFGDSHEQAALADQVRRVEARLREAPGDGKGWEVIAPVYLKTGRFREAANAYANAARLQGETVRLLAGLAEASVLASDGIVSEEARVAYEKVLKAEPGRVEARFWLAMAKEQDGRLADALSEYNVLLSEASPQAPYRSALTVRIQEVKTRMASVKGGAPAGPSAAVKADAPAGPSAADMAAAAKLTPDQRQQMIAQMVDGLAQRLKSNGKDLGGWLRLLQAYTVLGRKDDARSALAEARSNFDGDASALSELANAATKLGLGS